MRSRKRASSRTRTGVLNPSRCGRGPGQPLRARPSSSTGHRLGGELDTSIDTPHLGKVAGWIPRRGFQSGVVSGQIQEWRGVRYEVRVDAEVSGGCGASSAADSRPLPRPRRIGNNVRGLGGGKLVPSTDLTVKQAIEEWHLTPSVAPGTAAAYESALAHP